MTVVDQFDEGMRAFNDLRLQAAMGGLAETNHAGAEEHRERIRIRRCQRGGRSDPARREEPAQAVGRMRGAHSRNCRPNSPRPGSDSHRSSRARR